MTMLDELAPDVDIDVALGSFRTERARRRRARRVAWTASVGTIAIVLAIGGGLLARSSGSQHVIVRVAAPGATTTYPTPSPQLDAVGRRLLAIANRAAASNGGRAGHVDAVESTLSRAEQFSSGAIEQGDKLVWLIQVQGNFVCGTCLRPSGAGAPRGKVIQLIVDAGTYTEGSFGLQNTVLDLSRLGTVLVLKP